MLIPLYHNLFAPIHGKSEHHSQNWISLCIRKLIKKTILAHVLEYFECCCLAWVFLWMDIEDNLYNIESSFRYILCSCVNLESMLSFSSNHYHLFIRRLGWSSWCSFRLTFINAYQMTWKICIVFYCLFFKL